MEGIEQESERDQKWEELDLVTDLDRDLLPCMPTNPTVITVIPHKCTSLPN